MGDFFQAIQDTPVPTILIAVGLFILVLGFVTKIGGIIEVSPEQKKLTIPVGLFILCIGLVLHLSSGSSVTPTQVPTPAQAPAPTQAPLTSTQVIDESQPPPGIDRQIWEQCRSVQQILPAEEAGPNASGKQRNAEGLVRIPPSDQSGVWVDFGCPGIPGIYDW